MKQLIVNIKRLSLSIILIAGLSFTVNAQQVISLQQAVDLTLKNNLTIKQAQLNESLATEDYNQAKNNLLPSLSINANPSYNFGRSVNLTTYTYSSQSFLYVTGQAQAAFTLFQGGQLHNLILQNKLLLDVNKSTTAKVKNDLLLNVVTQYLAILTDQELLGAAKQQLALANITLDRAQKQFDAGNQTRADLAQAQAQVYTAGLNLTTNQNALDLAVLVLKQYMEMDPATNITVEKPDISKITDVKLLYNAADVITTAFATNPDIKLAELQQQTYAQAIKIAQGAYYPTVSLFGSIGSNFSSLVKNKLIGQTAPYYHLEGLVDQTNQKVYSVAQFSDPVYSNSYPFFSQFSGNANQSIGLSVQIPVFNRFTTRTSVRKAKISYDYAQLTTQLAKNTLSKTIIQAVLDLQAADKTYQAALQTYNANKEALNVTKQRYDAGLVNTLDYNTALVNYDKSQNDMIIDRYLVVFRSKVIDYYLGNPIIL